MSEERKLICSKCGAELVKRQVMFSYMRRTFGHEVPVCPKCGPGVFMATHGDRVACGKCGYTEFKKE